MKPESGESMTTCETPGCDKEAKLQCPTCIKLNIQVGAKFHGTLSPVIYRSS